MPELLNKLTRRIWHNNTLLVWARDTRRMRKFVRSMGGPAQPASTPSRIAVVLAPWSGSAVPWFSLVFGLLLGMRGNEVLFILDDLPFGDTGRRRKLELACIRSVLKLVGQRHRVVELGMYRHQASLGVAERTAIARLAHLNMVWAHRGESNIAPASIHSAQAQLEACSGAIGHFLQTAQLDVLFVPGGIWGSSGLWIQHARAKGIRIASYDSGGYGVLLLAVDGIACQLQDIPRAFALLQSHAVAADERSVVIECARKEIDKRRMGKDRFSSQLEAVHAKEARFEGAVLIALNSSWDSAALGLHTVFGSTEEWIVETVRYLLANTSAPVVVRQHPVERLAIARSSDDYRGLLGKHFSKEPRLHFIAAEDSVNSYDLLEQACAVVVYTSTIGVEAAALGKSVVTESSSYYSALGFVLKATTADQYFQHLSDVAAGRHAATRAMRDDALACYYITQCCNWVHTPFNVPDFTTWSRRTARDLAQERSVQSVLEAVETNTPIAFLNHLYRMGDAEAGRTHHQHA